MPRPRVEPGASQALVELRRAHLLARVEARATVPEWTSAPLTQERLRFFVHEAEELYWDELAWEQTTGEEAIAGGHLTELVFPGFLALVDALLPSPGSRARRGARTYPKAVEEILTFLGERAAELSAQLRAGADSQRLLWARAMTLRLIDLVLYRLYRLSAGECERLERLD
jgi:hypothetical protein